MIYQHLSAKKSELDKLPVLPADAQEELRKKSNWKLLMSAAFLTVRP